MDKINAGDKLQTKKKHPCGCDIWEVLYAGSDVKIKCTGCERAVMVPRSKLIKSIKAYLGNEG